MPILVAAGVLMMLASAGDTDPSGASILLGIAVVCFLVAVYQYWGRPLLTARRMLRDDPCAKDGIQHLVSADGFGVRTGAITVDIKWSHIRKVVETKDFVLYYYTRSTAYFTPKRVIPEADLPILRSSLKQWVGERATLSSAPSSVAA